MVNELDMLERKIAEVAALCRSLRADNVALRQSLAAENKEKLNLAKRINTARGRLDALAKQLPEAKI